MGVSYGSCHHELEGDGHVVALPEMYINFDLDGMDRTIVTVTLCDKCYEMWKPYILDTQEKKDAWLRGDLFSDEVW